MNIIIARVISYILNPILVLIVVPSLLVYKSTNDPEYTLSWTAYSFVFLLIITTFMLYGVRKGIFSDLDVSKREERPLLFLVSIILSAIYMLGLLILHGPKILLLTIIGIIVGILLVSVINRHIKASIHVATLSALIFAVAIVYGGYYFLLLLLIPIVGWARVTVKRHTVSETIVGGILGSLLSLGTYILLKLFYR